MRLVVQFLHKAIDYVTM